MWDLPVRVVHWLLVACVAIAGRIAMPLHDVTAYDAIARLYDPDQGRLLLDGHDLRELETSLQQFGEFVLKAQLVKEKAAPAPSRTASCGARSATRAISRARCWPNRLRMRG